MRSQRSRHRWGPMPLRFDVWRDAFRPLWVSSLKRRGLPPVLMNMTLKHLDRVRPGTRAATSTAEDVWLEVEEAVRHYQAATNQAATNGNGAGS